MDSILELPGLPASQRRGRLDAWVADHQAEAISSLVEELAPLLSAAETASLLDAEQLWIPLSRLAGTASGHAASLLWAWAASSALIRGELADLAPGFACDAVAAEPDDALAWEVFDQSASEGLEPVMLERIEEWMRSSPALAERALSRLARLAPHWQERSVRALDRLRDLKEA